MRRRFSLALLAVLVVLAILASTRYFASRSAVSHPANVPTDTTGVADVPREIDTSCIASRVGLPCTTP